MSTEREAKALARLEKIADIVDDLCYAVGGGLEGTRTAKHIRESVATIRAALSRTEGERVALEKLKRGFVGARDHFRAGTPLIPLGVSYMEGAAHAWETAVIAVDRILHAPTGAEDTKHD